MSYTRSSSSSSLWIWNSLKLERETSFRFHLMLFPSSVKRESPRRVCNPMKTYFHDGPRSMRITSRPGIDFSLAGASRLEFSDERSSCGVGVTDRALAGVVTRLGCWKCRETVRVRDFGLKLHLAVTKSSSERWKFCNYLLHFSIWKLWKFCTRTDSNDLS